MHLEGAAVVICMWVPSGRRFDINLLIHDSFLVLFSLYPVFVCYVVAS